MFWSLNMLNTFSETFSKEVLLNEALFKERNAENDWRQHSTYIQPDVVPLVCSMNTAAEQEHLECTL